VEGLEAKHFLDPVPGGDFGFNKDDAEDDSNEEVHKISH